MLVNANANNLEAVKAVSNILYVCTYLYELCTDFSLTCSIFVVLVVCTLYLIAFRIYTHAHIFI